MIAAVSGIVAVIHANGSAIQPAGPGTALVELRVLDGANLYFPRPAIKLTLDVPGLLSLPEERAAAAFTAAAERGRDQGGFAKLAGGPENLAAIEAFFTRT